MQSSIYLRQVSVAIFLFANTFAFGQNNGNSIKAKWIIEKLEVDQNTPQAIKANEELIGLCLTIKEQELVISKNTQIGDSIIKSGPYSLSGNTLTIGHDTSTVILLTDKQMRLRLPRQGVLFLNKLK